jgi:hypothetical protein
VHDVFLPVCAAKKRRATRPGASDETGGVLRSQAAEQRSFGRRWLRDGGVRRHVGSSIRLGNTVTLQPASQENSVHRTALAAVAILLVASSPALATWTVTAGNWTVVAGASGQTLDAISANPIVIVIAGDGAGFQGADLGLTVEDGTIGPLLEDVDMLGGVFLTDNNGQSDFETFPTRAQLSAVTSDADVGPNGVLALLTIDTTGVPVGVYDLFLHYDEDFFSATVISGIPNQSTVLIDGTLTVIPEPSSIILALVAAAGLCAAYLCARARKLA